MMIYTTNFNTVERLKCTGAFNNYMNSVAVSIAGDCPVNFYHYRKLAPRWAWWKEWDNKFANNRETKESLEFYLKNYRETVLSKQDPKRVLEDLQMLSNDGTVFLCCYEEFPNFCHRYEILRWLHENGADITEFGYPNALDIYNNKCKDIMIC